MCAWQTDSLQAEVGASGLFAPGLRKAPPTADVARAVSAFVRLLVPLSAYSTTLKCLRL